MAQIAQFKVDVTSLKSKGPIDSPYFDVRAYGPGQLFSLFFEMDDPSLAPLIGEGLLITVENQRTPAVSEETTTDAPTDQTPTE
jgi:hypothetical protein